MSRFHVPTPDYDYTMRQGNPYIPTPDYTIKYHKHKNRPSLSNVGMEHNFHDEAEYSELPPINIPTEVPSKSPAQGSQKFRRPFHSDRQQFLKPLDEDFNYPEIKQHSYIEDRDEEERHISAKEHIKQIGVPVLPGMVTPMIPAQSLELSAAPVSSDQNRAFLRHLENHKKFDTFSGGRGIDNCEICQIMRKQLEAEQQDSGHQSWESQRFAEHHAPNQHSSHGGRRKIMNARDIFQIEEQPEPEPYLHAISTRARYNYDKRREDEASVRAMEQVDILQLNRGYALCRKSDNTIGWVPSSVFEQ